MFKKIKEAFHPVIEGAKHHKIHLHIYHLVTFATILFRAWLYLEYITNRLLLFLSDIMLIAVIGYTIYVFRKFSDAGLGIKEANRAKIEAEQANEAKTQFLANMSHEIRTPINAIIGMNEMIIRENRDKTIAGYAENIEVASQNLLSLVNDILDFSKIESGRMEIVESEYHLGELINELETIFKMKADGKGLRLKFDINYRMPQRLTGDSVRVKQICMNLLSNAVKYTDEGQVSMSMDWNRIKDGSAIITIRVSDTGRGIKSEDLSGLFDKFQRADLKNNNNIEGTGLGLSITKTLAERMHGSISVESKYGEGSTFTVTLIQGVHDPEPMGDYRKYVRKDKTRDMTEFSAPEAHILAVDDTPLNLDVIKGLLKNLGSHIDTAESGMECLEKAAATKYDVILMDARMPHMDGSETLKELKERDLLKDTAKVLILTADAMAGARERYLAEGFDGYLLKPIKPEVLEEAIQKALPEKLIGPPLVRDDGRADGVPAWLYDNDEINPKDGLVLCGTVDTYLSTLKSFSKYAEETIDEMKRALRSGEIESFTIKIHALKSSARLVGANRLSEQALRLEEAGNRKDAEYINAHIGSTLQLYSEIAGSLQLLDEEKKQSKGVIDMEDIPELFRHLKEYVEDFNDLAVSSMLTGIGSYAFPGKEQERYNKLVRAHDAVDWAEMMRLLEEF